MMGSRIEEATTVVLKLKRFHPFVDRLFQQFTANDALHSTWFFECFEVSCL